MIYENLRVEKRERVLEVTVDRPEKLNALDDRTIEELLEIFGTMEKSPEVGAAILTGAGEKSFIAGADIAELGKLDPRGAKGWAEKGQKLVRLIEAAPVPVLAAVNGYALGGGCEVAMACAIRIASENARFGQPEVSLGILPGYGGTQRLVRLAGRGRALEMLLTGDMIDAEEAYRIGLVNRVVPLAKLIDEVRRLAARILSRAPQAIRYCLEAVRSGVEHGLEAGLRQEAALFALAFATEDMREGTRAFLEKRQPRFSGK